MKITGANIEKVQIPLKGPFKVAFTTVNYLESVLTQVSADNGYIRFGEAAPFAPVTGETVDGITTVLELFKTGLLGMDLMDIEAVHAVVDGAIVRNGAAKYAVDLATYGPMERSMGLPTYKLLGGYGNVVHSDITIGISSSQPTTAGAKHLVETEGYHILKIKAGINYEDDILAIKLIREAAGPNIRLRVNTNQSCSISNAVYTLEGSEGYGTEAVERCLSYWGMEGSAFIHSKVNGIQIMLNGSIHGPMDVAKACRLRAADILNIKLMKCSGLYPASKISAAAEADDVACMVGYMLGTKLAITIGLSPTTTKKNVTGANCDSFLYYKENPIEGGFTQERDILTLLDEPGFGVYLNM